MSFCGECGHELNGEKFCPSCGKPIHEPIEEQPGSDTQNVQAKKGAWERIRDRMGVIIAAIVVFVVVVGSFVLTARGPGDTSKQYMRALMNANAKKAVSLMPDKVVDYVTDKYFDGSDEDMLLSVQESLNGFKDAIDELDVRMSRIRYKVIDTDKMKKSTIKQYEEQFKEIDLDIKEGKEVEIEVTIPDGEDEETRTQYVSIVKIGRSWYILGIN